jgi:hypothetical protein
MVQDNLITDLLASRTVTRDAKSKSDQASITHALNLRSFGETKAADALETRRSAENACESAAKCRAKCIAEYSRPKGVAQSFRWISEMIWSSRCKQYLPSPSSYKV